MEKTGMVDDRNGRIELNTGIGDFAHRTEMRNCVVRTS